MGNDKIAVSRVPSFDDLLFDPMQQFDRRSELLSSVLQYLAAPPASAGTPPWTVGSSLNQEWLFSPVTATTGTAVA